VGRGSGQRIAVPPVILEESRLDRRATNRACAPMRLRPPQLPAAISFPSFGFADEVVNGPQPESDSAPRFVCEPIIVLAELV
jgi:hypothetical protein